MPTKLSIAVLTYRNWRTLLPDCLKSIDYPAEEKFILDNGSRDAVEPVDGWEVHHLIRNVGNIQGQNMCMAIARNPLVLFVSDDVRFKPGAIAKLVSEATLGQTGPAILWPNGEIQALGGQLDENFVGRNKLVHSEKDMIAGRVDYIPSITYLMHKQSWEKVGGFDARFPGAYEDVEMGLALGKYHMKIVPQAEAIHLGNATLSYGWKDKWRFWKGRRMARKSSAVIALPYVPK